MNMMQQREMKNIGKTTEVVREAYEGLPIIHDTEKNRLRQQIALALMSPLEMNSEPER